MTGPAVDLAAVRTARTALAAIVAEHPELTGATARARLAANLPEIIAMPPRLDPDSADSTIVGVRMTPEMRDALDAEVSRQRALNPDVSIGRSNVLRGIVRRALLGSIVTPSTSAPAAPAAPAPSRPVVARVEAVEPPAAAPVDPRQLPLLAAAAPVVALHRTADGSSVASRIGNDNAEAPTTPKPKRARSAVKTADVNVVDLDALKVRLAAAVVAGHTLKALSREGKFSDSSVVMWRNGRRASIGPEVAAKLDAVVTSHGF